MSMFWTTCILFEIGFILGYIVTTIITRKKFDGVLKYDSYHPDEEPYLFLELSKNEEFILRKKYVIFKVDTKSYLSRK